MGLFKDDIELTASNKNDSRKFKVSEISPFSSNIYFKLHECKKENGNEYLISMQINEKQIEFPQCENTKKENQFFCSFDFINNYFINNHFSNFNFNSTCGIQPECSSFIKAINKISQQNKSLTVILVSIFIIFALLLLSYFAFVSFLCKKRNKPTAYSYQLDFEKD